MNSKRIVLISAGLIVFFTFAFFAGMFVRGLIMDFSKTELKEKGYQVVEEVPVQEEKQIPQGGSTLTVDDQGNAVYTTAQTNESLTIEWFDVNRQVIFPLNEALFDAVCPTQFVDQNADYGMGPVPSFNLCGVPAQATARRLGTVKGGTYDGRFLDMMTFAREELGTSYRSFYFLSDPNEREKNVIVDAYGISVGFSSFSSKTRTSSLEMMGWDAGSLNDPQAIFDTGLKIPDLDFANRLEGKNGELYRFVGYWVRFDEEKAQQLMQSTKQIALKDGTFLLAHEPLEVPAEKVTGDDLYFFIDQDGRLLGYDLEMPFFKYGVNEYDGSTNFVSGVPQITWTNGTKNAKTYIKGKLGGCGYMDSTHVIPETTARDLNLVQVATSNDGSKMPIFEPSSYNIEYYKDAFNVVTWENAPIEGEAPKAVLRSYKEFVHPYLYVMDANGRWVEMLSNEIVPPVECGKPVIYLYPPKPTDLIVSLAPQGGFSYTEPVYNKGWRVTANPDGQLVNKDDGKTYPYLFWEGRGGLYAAPEKNWVIAKDQVETFLNNTLVKMNLNAQETKDFIEFWLPRMQEKPFYRIGFHGTQMMDTLAPMSLSVKPDHTFRILMDYTPLETNEPANPPTVLPKANRSGFTVIEWGGVLR